MAETITGRLEEWEVFPAISATGGLRCGGFIYGDANERWPDGTWIMTSICAALYDDFKEDAVIRTRNSTYRLGKRRQIEHQP